MSPKAKNNKLDRFVQPMLAKATEQPFNDADWVFEIKWDGYRAIADLRNGVQITSRNGVVYKKGFEPIIADLHNQKHQMILDGELVAIDEHGMPNFQLLQSIQTQKATVVFQVFDLLWLNGHSTENLTLVQRKELLKEALLETNLIKYHDYVEANGKAFFDLVVSKGLEGMMAKKKTSTYTQGLRTEHWLKVRNYQRDEIFVCGYTNPQGDRKHFGSLIAGQLVDGVMTYAGHVGTGFSESKLKELLAIMQDYKTEVCPFETLPKRADESTWLTPILKADIRFTEQTNDGIFRHPVFLKLLNPSKEVEQKTAPIVAVQPDIIPLPIDQEEESIIIPVKVSNPDKIYWKPSGITKLEMIEYYQRIQEFILPHLQNRPQSLNRHPDGYDGLNFYQKNAPDFTRKHLQTIAIDSESSGREIHYILCNDAKSLAYLNNLGCIELNSWTSRVGSLLNPDYLTLDLDPSPNNTFADVVTVAQAVKQVLDKAKINGYCKTSGSKGIHIYVPLGAKYNYEQARGFAFILLQKVKELLPNLTTFERNLKKRSKQKIYLDYLQNSKGQTLANVYSVRPRLKATVSTPILWEELKPTLHPTDFTIKNVPGRLQQVGDLFLGVLGEGIDMLAALQYLEE